MTAAKIMVNISRLPGCARQAADAVSAYTPGKNGGCTQLTENSQSECPDIWMRPPKHNWPKSWSSMEDLVVPLDRNLYGHPLTGLLRERQFGKILLKYGWEKGFPIGNAYSYTVKKDYSYLCMWMTYNWLERNTILIRCGKYSTTKLIWENQHLSWIMHTWAALKDNVKKAKISWTITEPFSNREFSREEQKNCHLFKIFVFLHDLMTWLVMHRSVWNDTVSWQTGRLNNSTKYPLHASMTTTSKKKK